MGFAIVIVIVFIIHPVAEIQSFNIFGAVLQSSL